MTEQLAWWMSREQWTLFILTLARRGLSIQPLSHGTLIDKLKKCRLARWEH